MAPCYQYACFNFENRRARAYKSNELAPESLPLKIFQKLFLLE